VDHRENKTDPLSQYLNDKTWNELFPHRYALNGTGKDFYSLASFREAAGHFPGFLTEKEDSTRRRELAAFLAHIAQETSGGWAQAPGGYFAWGLYFVSEAKGQRAPLPYADTSKHLYLPVAGKAYYGRGPAQLSWNYNYGQFSEAWFGDKNVLLQHPEELEKDPVLAFGSAIWFWMTAQPPKPSCHAVMSGDWIPGPDDLAKGRRPGFGATVNIINGGVECGSGQDQERTRRRYDYYRHFCAILHANPGENVGCASQKPFGQ
jgi:hypothetical protein